MRTVTISRRLARHSFVFDGHYNHDELTHTLLRLRRLPGLSQVVYVTAGSPSVSADFSPFANGSAEHFRLLAECSEQIMSVIGVLTHFVPSPEMPPGLLDQLNRWGEVRERICGAQGDNPDEMREIYLRECGHQCQTA